MIEEYKKLGIFGGIAGVMFILLMVFLFVDISLGPIQIASISTILSQYDEVTKAEAGLISTQSAYNTTLLTLDRAKNTYQNEKGKYEAISDETIAVIKEATTQEEYSIEYMWIRLGNYAKINNLSIVLVEPGGGQNINTSDNTTTSTPVASSSSSSSNTTNSATGNTSNSDNSLLGNDRGDTFKIQVSGSYMNVSDFVFAVENDSELRFKLDNIAMEYVSGTTIKTTFDVKNMVILK